MRSPRLTTIQISNTSCASGKLCTPPARPKRRTKTRSLNFREGMKRLGIVVSVVCSICGGIYGYLLVVDIRALSANGFRQESVLVDYCIASLLPVLGFWGPWEIIHFLIWVGSAFSERSSVREQGHTRLAVNRRKFRISARG